jgi:isoleucyl-tRNA synthetase
MIKVIEQREATILEAYKNIARHVVSKHAFKNVITTGTVAGNDGRKMSKSLGNFTDPNELMDQFSADALRFLLLSSPLLSGEDFALKDKDVSDVARKLSMVWNMYDFFTMYAEVDDWEFAGALAEPQDLKNPLDSWVIARLYMTARQIEENMDKYNIPDAMSASLPFIDDASNWFVRRSRRRFWKSEDDGDKKQAYATLHYVLAYLALLLAPFTPFLAEELWHKLVDEKSSVHLQDFPQIGTSDEKVLTDMCLTREVIEKGLALRMEKEDGFGQIKVRQPLAKVVYRNTAQLSQFYEQIIIDEVNIKAVVFEKSPKDLEVELDKKLTKDLKQEGLVRELIRFIQNARKKAGLNVDDRILLSLLDYDFAKLPAELLELIKAETLATKITGENYAYDEIVEVEGKKVTISLEKV